MCPLARPLSRPRRGRPPSCRRRRGPSSPTRRRPRQPRSAADPKDKGSRGSKVRGPAKASGRGPRRARLQLRRIDTWSALKISLVLSIALFFIWMVAVGVLYGVLNALDVFDTLNDLFGQIGSRVR